MIASYLRATARLLALLTLLNTLGPIPLHPPTLNVYPPTTLPATRRP